MDKLYTKQPYKVADIGLADFGRKEIDMAEKEMLTLSLCVKNIVTPSL